MDIKAQHKNARVSPRKLRTLRSALLGRAAGEAAAELQFMPGKASGIIRRVLQSAIANAKHNYRVEADALIVQDVVIDGGFTMKRFQPASKGMAHPILKRTAHVTVVLRDRADTVAPQPKKTPADIETITSEEMIARAAKPPEGPPQESTKAKGLSEVPRSKQEQAFQIKKMRQQGGDPKKTHRRKSLGE